MSVTAVWETKIWATVKRLEENFTEIRNLVYVTNASIGPAADDLKYSLAQEKGINLDIRDSSWFVDRQYTNAQRGHASESLIDLVLSPLFKAAEVTARVGTVLSEQEARVGLLHLALDASDQASEKGLTKSCFESLVIAALHDTNLEVRITKKEVLERVENMLPASPREQVVMYSENALERLSKKRGRVKHWQHLDEYCLSNSEVQTIRAQLSEFLDNEQKIASSLGVKLATYVDSLNEGQPRFTNVIQAAKESLEEVLLSRGEAFASAVADGRPQALNVDALRATIVSRHDSALKGLKYDQIVDGICAFVADADEATLAHLRRLADAYTLFAFMRQTPDVQKAVVKLFSEGDIWLDTTVILPLMTERLAEDDSARTYTNLLKAARHAGLNLYVTTGVIDEVDAHLTNAVNCSKTMAAAWQSRVPFVYSEYVQSGAALSGFVAWVNDFRGSLRPVDDILDFLDDEFGIKNRDLTTQVEQAADDLRRTATEYWYAVHERRRNSRNNPQRYVDPDVVSKLVQHDVECTVGILAMRGESSGSPLGYKEWWLCLDRAAFAFEDRLRERLSDWRGGSPILNPDFLAEYLRIGPLRTALDVGHRVAIPVLADIARRRLISPQLVELADKVRQEHASLSERRIRREVRDALDKARVFARAEGDSSLGELDVELDSINK